MEKIERNNHWVQLIAGVLGIVAVLSTLLAKGATDAKAQAQTRVVEVQGDAGRLQTDVDRLGKQNEALQAKVDDLTRQLTAADAGAGATSSQPAPGTLRYSARILKIQTDFCRTAYGLDIINGRVGRQGQDSIALDYASCTPPGDKPVRLSPTAGVALSTATTSVATQSECEAAVAASPVDDIDLSAERYFCVITASSVAHITVVRHSGYMTTFRATAWVRQ